MIPYIRGLIAKQAHVSVPDGTVEEEYARNGFTGKYAHLYRSSAPTNWLDIEGPLKPRAYDLKKQHHDQIAQRSPILKNSEVEISFITLKEPMPYYFRNADADDLYFVHSGSGKVETDFGPLKYGQGDYLLIPRGTVYRFFPQEVTETLLMESFGELRYPDRGMLGQHALFDPAVIEVPTPDPSSSTQGTSKLKIKRLNQITTITYPGSPITTVGWKGTLTAQKLNVRDIRPVLSDRYHLPPSAHTTFVGNQFVVCTFLPRPLENGDPEAMKVPFYHSNIDFDEVLFYHSGQFFSREGISPGMLTYHPQGIHHGPQPKAIERSKELKSTSEVAVMIDTKNPLYPTASAEACENRNYWKSWQA